MRNPFYWLGFVLAFLGSLVMADAYPVVGIPMLAVLAYIMWKLWRIPP